MNSGELPLRYTLIGRILPERAMISADTPRRARFEAGQLSGEAELLVRFSNLHVRIFSECVPQSSGALVSIAQQLTSPIVNFLGFRLCATYRIVFDHLIDHSERSSELISVIEPIFESGSEPHFTFRQIDEFEPIGVDPSLISKPQLRVALEELSTALNRPMLTPMHCYIALEYVRELHEGATEKERWESMRNLLSISRNAVMAIELLAKDQKHGKIEYISWEQRKRCLQIAWEIVHRQIQLDADVCTSFPQLE